MAPKTRITRTEQGEQEQGRARTTSQAPPLPSIPAPVLSSAWRGTGRTGSWGSRGRAPSPSGTVVWPHCASHHHATCTPALFHATRCCTTLRVRHALDLRYHSHWPCAVDLVFALPQANPAAAPDGNHEQEHEDWTNHSAHSGQGTRRTSTGVLRRWRSRWATTFQARPQSSRGASEHPGQCSAPGFRGTSHGPRCIYGVCLFQWHTDRCSQLHTLIGILQCLRAWELRLNWTRWYRVLDFRLRCGFPSALLSSFHG